MTGKDLYEDNERMADENLIWQEVNTEHIVRDKWIDFRRVRYRMPDGSEFEPYYNYSRRDYVVIVATDKDGKYLCVRQFRHGIGKCTTEFTAGGIETDGEKDYASDSEPDMKKEDALETAKRELKEETGHISDRWEHIITVPSNPSIADNYAYIYRAYDCEKVSGQSLDDTEFLNVIKLSEEELIAEIKSGDFMQPVHIMAYLADKNGLL